MPEAGVSSVSRSERRHARKRRRLLLRVELHLGQAVVQVVVVRLQVEMTVAGQPEQDHTLATLLSSRESLVTAPRIA
jgi:hypothetical protein